MGLRRHVRINTTGLLASTGFLLKYPWADSQLLPAPGGASHAPPEVLDQNTLFGRRLPSNDLKFPIPCRNKVSTVLWDSKNIFLVWLQVQIFPAHFIYWLAIASLLHVSDTLEQWCNSCLFCLSNVPPQFLSPILQGAFLPRSICQIWFIARVKPEIGMVGSQLGFLSIRKLSLSWCLASKAPLNS